MSHSPASPQPSGCCVLIVESSSESREVLRTVLARRGLRTIDTSDAQQGLLLADRHRPGVIVLDLESSDDNRQSVCDQYAARSLAAGASLVLLGSVSRAPQLAHEQHLSKPYHYGPLVRTIEQLAQRAVQAAHGQAPA